MLMMMLKFCVKESSNLIGLANFVAAGCLITLSVRKWPNLPWPPPLPTKFLHYYYLILEIKEQKQKMVIKIFSNRISQFSWAIFIFSVEAYLYVKNLTCCFESLWTRLTTSTWNDWNCYFFCFLTTSKKLTS